MKKLSFLLITFSLLSSALTKNAHAQTMTINNGIGCDVFVYAVVNDACDLAISGPYLVPAGMTGVTIVSWLSTTAWTDGSGTVLTGGVPSWWTWNHARIIYSLGSAKGASVGPGIGPTCIGTFDTPVSLVPGCGGSSVTAAWVGGTTGNVTINIY